MGAFLFAGGLALLLGGLSLLKAGLTGLAGSALRSALRRCAGTPVRAALTGTVLTALVQSSTAVSILTMGFADAGLLGLPQAIGVILGANVGTCLTVQLLSLDAGRLAPALLAAGLGLWIAERRTRAGHAGRALTGLGAVFLGLDAMGAGLTPWQEQPWFRDVLLALRGNPWLAAAAAAGLTGLLHSSSAATGLVITLGRQGLIDLKDAVILVVGNNVGTCFTALLAAAGSTTSGRRIAAAHLLLNILGALAVLPLAGPFATLVGLTAADLDGRIANAHTLFNLVSSAAVLPFAEPFARLVAFLVPERGYRRRKRNFSRRFRL
ncbi:MAG: Na/Pi symporter [Bacillota bacterium]